MKNRNLITVCILAILLTSEAFAQISEDAKRSDYNQNKPEREEWFRDAGLGMMLHWSLDSQLGMVISHSIVGSSKDYRDRYYKELPKTFNPTKFDASEIARIARMSGMKYVVLTTKHHSGFCLWDTKTTDFNIMNTPYGKDIVKAFVDAVRAQGLAVGFYYSPEDWLFVDKQGALVKRVDRDKISKSFRKAYDKYMVDQLTELLTNYGKIDMMFLDGGHWPPAKKACWSLQPDIIITRGAMESPEQTVADVVMDHPWEAAITINNQWQYKPSQKFIKEGRKLIEILIESRAKGGNLVLNLGPKPSGELDIDEEEPLRELAAWMFVNQEAIYNVRPWIVSHEDNIWFTKAKDENTVYVHLTGHKSWERGDRKEFVLKSVKATKKTKIEVVGHDGLVVEYQPDKDPKSYAVQKGDGLHLSVIRAQRIYNNNFWPNAVVVKLTNVEPVYKVPEFTTLEAEKKNDKVYFLGKVNDLKAFEEVQVRFDYRVYPGFHESIYYKDWESTHWMALDKAEEFRVVMESLVKDKEYEFRVVLQTKYGKLYGNINKVRP
ncbi:alpha-L-fucosidase [Tamlana sp. 2201CG12-4]|uniref:alpha-L-fucosidase n=1 Tax=Tamlana sp. 2201CG12-4 TaxID=3112582 RepID=UPI002DB94696|nr:alpha-L-fucosidase [Tamlana sp. 2201CG12-4]MEC3908500.1 alpha-L-fucosidase [Tamlana sp. 2201CG12-4]